MTPPQPADRAEAACAGRRTDRSPVEPGGPRHAVSRASDFTELLSEVIGPQDETTSSGPPLSMRELRRLLRGSNTATSEPVAAEMANPKPVSRAHEHQQLRQANDESSVRVSSVNRVYAHVVATRQSFQAAEAEEQASHDEWLADVRSRQQHTRLQREHRAQKVQSDF